MGSKNRNTFNICATESEHDENIFKFSDNIFRLPSRIGIPTYISNSIR